MQCISRICRILKPDYSLWRFIRCFQEFTGVPSTENSSMNKGKKDTAQLTRSEKLKITGANVYSVHLPLSIPYKFGDTKTMSALDCTVLEIITNKGIRGYGEVCPFGSAYVPGFALGVLAGLRELLPLILGADPLELNKLNQIMDNNMTGHSYVKAPIDVACWDILGKACNQPLCTLLGGRFGESVPVYETIVQGGSDKDMLDLIEILKAQGYEKVQLKVGSNITDEIRRIKLAREALPSSSILFIDANGVWLAHEALRVLEAVKHLDIYVEHPCKTYEENKFIRRHTNLPIVLDEVVNDMSTVARAAMDRAGDVLKVKVCTQGGLTKAKQVRDFCVSMGMSVCIEQAWVSDITAAAIAHLAQSTPSKYLFSSSNLRRWMSIDIARGSPHLANGRMTASDKPGLGIEPIMDVLGEPVFSF